METDKDHIHYMIETEPTMSISKIVNMMKSYTTYHIWKRYPQYLRKHLQIKNMVKNHRLAKPISDVSWYELTRQLEYKAKWNGRKYVKIDRELSILLQTRKTVTLSETAELKWGVSPERDASFQA